MRIFPLPPKAVMLSLIFATASMLTQAQSKQTCETPGNTIEDINSIAKCVIQKDKKDGKNSTRQISVRISAPKRFLKKRKREAVDGLNTSGVSNTEHAKGVNKSMLLKTNIAALSNNLSREEVRLAQKFSSVDVLPTFTECEGKAGKKGKQLDCFNQGMINHIQEHFTYPDEAMINKIQGDVWVRFIIDQDGSVSNIKTLGPKGGKLLNDEAVRVVSNLPKFKPAVKDGKAVSVKYGFPISFALAQE